MEQLRSFVNHTSRSVIGLISGMSMDGVDLAHVDISGDFPNLHIHLRGSHFLPYTAQLKADLKDVLISSSAKEIARLDLTVGEFFAQAVMAYFETSGVNATDIHAIGSHGQTIFGEFSDQGSMTIQIGSGSVIASRTGRLTVYNFRQRDIAEGGKCAPLIPLLDYVMFRESGKTIALHNLGSISNVTIVTEELEDVFASDLGPANMPIDYFAKNLKASPGVDKDGAYSSRGKVHAPLLKELLANSFLDMNLPKAAGYGEFGPAYLEEMRRKYSDVATHDLLRTAVEWSALSTVEAYKKFIFPKFPQLQTIRFSGGGVYNQTLMKRLKELLPNHNVESLADTAGNFSDAKEAVLFALLAHETLHGRPGNVPNVTGARRTVPLGDIVQP